MTRIVQCKMPKGKQTVVRRFEWMKQQEQSQSAGKRKGETGGKTNRGRKAGAKRGRRLAKIKMDAATKLECKNSWGMK